MFEFLIMICVGSSVYLLVNYLFSLRMTRYNLLIKLTGAPSLQKKKLFTPAKILKPLNPVLRPFYRLTYLQELQEQLTVLRINNDLAVVVFSKIFMAVITGVLLFQFFHTYIYAIAGVLVGFFIPDFILLRKIKAKKEQISKGFPESVDLLDLCIGAGLDFTSSIKWVTDKTESNAFVEQLQTVLSEIRIGKSQTQALKDMAKRLKLPDINSFVRSVVQAENMGTSLEEAFRNLSEDTRQARFQAGERYAIKASLKILIPLLFFILPVIMIVVAGPIIVQFSTGGLSAGFGAAGFK